MFGTTLLPRPYTAILMRFHFVVRRSFVAVLFLAIRAAVVVGQEPASPDSVPTKWPEKVVVTIGDVRTRIDGPKRWTLSGLDWQGVRMATEDSAYGTVLVIRDVGLLGTAHFLDVAGKPGEVEKEQVTRLQFYVDDRPITDLTPTMNLVGKSFRMERRSKMRGLDLETSIVLRDGVLVETARFRATAPLDLRVTYPWMYAFAPEARRFVFGDPSGVQRRGDLMTEGKAASQVVQHVDWAGVFDPASGKGSVCCFTKRPDKTDGALLLVDAPGSYRKVAGYCLVDTMMPAGFDGAFQAAVGFFTAKESDWETLATRRAAEIRRSAAALADQGTPPPIAPAP